MSYSMSTTKTWRQTYLELGTCFQRWANERGVRIDWSLENMRGHRDVTLRYTLPGEPEVILEMADHSTAEDNLRVLYLAVEAMRLNEKRGIAGLIKQAYLALPVPKAVDPYEVLQVRAGSDPEIVKAAYRTLSKRYHPDSGSEPNPERMVELNEARDRLLGAVT